MKTLWSLMMQLWESWKCRHQLNERQISKQEMEFLPGALEIQETPPAPWGRVVAWNIILLFTLGILWSIFSKVDVVTIAEGQIISSGRIKQIQPYDKGVVKTILVTEGQKVQKGEPLVELDQSITKADQQRLMNELHLTELELLRHEEMGKLLTIHQKNKKNDADLDQEFETFKEKFPTNSSFQEIQYHRQLLLQQWQQYLSEYNALKSNYAQQVAEKESIEALIKKFKGTLPLIKKQSAALKKLVDQKLAAEMTWLETEEKRIEQKQALVVEQARKKMLEASIKEIEHQLIILETKNQTNNLSEIGELRRQRLSLIEELSKAKSLYEKQILTAPVSGEVQELAIHTVGGVVTPAQKLMVIVPTNDTLQVEAVLENKDIGFVYEGQQAEIKVHTFPFTKYGVIDAKVIGMTDNAIADEKKGLIYKMRLLMQQTEMLVNGKMVKLIPGMTVTAEIKTGKRRLIEYFLTPLLRYKQESVRER